MIFPKCLWMQKHTSSLGTTEAKAENRNEASNIAIEDQIISLFKDFGKGKCTSPECLKSICDYIALNPDKQDIKNLVIVIALENYLKYAEWPPISQALKVLDISSKSSHPREMDNDIYVANKYITDEINLQEITPIEAVRLIKVNWQFIYKNPRTYLILSNIISATKNGDVYLLNLMMRELQCQLGGNKIAAKRGNEPL